jgi:hypothetical protein
MDDADADCEIDSLVRVVAQLDQTIALLKDKIGPDLSREITQQLDETTISSTSKVDTDSPLFTDEAWIEITKNRLLDSLVRFMGNNETKEDLIALRTAWRDYRTAFCVNRQRSEIMARHKNTCFTCAHWEIRHISDPAVRKEDQQYADEHGYLVGCMHCDESDGTYTYRLAWDAMCKNYAFAPLTSPR